MTELRTVDEPQSDPGDHPRWDRLRPLGRRRLLVVGVALAVASVVGTAAAGLDGFKVLALAGMWGAVFVLRQVVRTMADLPEERLDERMVATRDRAYLASYRALVSVGAALLVVAYIALDASRFDWQPTADQIEAVMWGFMGVGIALPSAVLAWTETEI